MFRRTGTIQRPLPRHLVKTVHLVYDAAKVEGIDDRELTVWR
jgi:hypothetical protein